MPTRCEFFFDHPDAVYFSGEVVNGKVVLTTDKVKRVRGIFITVKGAAKVHWTERRTRRRNNKSESYSVYYHGEQQYLYSRVQVEGQVDFPAGVHEYTFTTPLPPQIPSTVIGQHGEVSYEVELQVDRALKLDSVYSNAFTVIKALNLNLDASYLTPSKAEGEKTFGCCCCASQPVKAELCTEFSGYAPGQKINFTLLIDNESNNDLERSMVKLMRSMSFKSQSPEIKVKNARNEVGNCILGGAMRLTKKLYKGFIEVPAMAPTTMDVTDIVSVSYYLVAEVHTGFCSSNLDVITHITLGTVPLIASATNPNSVRSLPPTTHSSDGENGEDAPPQYESVVPPTFEEATAMDQPFVDPDENENRVQEPFVPKYPVYHNFATPSAPAEEQTLLISGPQSVGGQPITEQPRISHNRLPYPVHPLPSVPTVPGVGRAQEKGTGPNIGWLS